MNLGAAFRHGAQSHADALYKELVTHIAPILDAPSVIVEHGGPGILAVAYFSQIIKTMKGC